MMMKMLNFSRLLSLLCLLLLLPGGGHATTEPVELSRSRLIPKVLKLIRANYVEPKRIAPDEMLKGALNALQQEIPEILVNFQSGAVAVTIGQAARHFSTKGVSDLASLWDHLSEILSFVDLNYHGETKPQELEYVATDGILESLDPHSNLLRPKEFQEFQVGTKGNFGGIGIMIGVRDGQLTVIEPLPGTPADRAGIKPKDRITQINEDSTVNMGLSEAVELLRGPIGSTVVLTVERDKRAPLTVTLKRDDIHIDSVQSTLLTNNEQHIGYIKVKNFQENTVPDLREALADLKQMVAQRHGAPRTEYHQRDGADPDRMGLDGLILDVRNNPGGLLYQAVELVDLFLREGVIVSTVGARGHFVEEHSAKAPATEPAYPMVVLVNEGSASASEIIAGALQSNDRALVVGTQTYGKGSVQTVYNLSGGSALKLTIAEYLTAGKHAIQEVGVTPDIALIPVTVHPEHMNLVEDKHHAERDLEKRLQWGAQPATPSAYRMHYVQAYVEPDEEERSSSSNTLDVDGDFAVDFAKALMSAAAEPSQYPWLNLSTTIGAIQRGEDLKMAAELSKLGISWQSGGSASRPSLHTHTAIQQNGQPVATVRAGEEAELVVTVKNTGPGTAERLIAQTESDFRMFSNKEFVFGRLVPSQERRWTVPFKVDQYLVSQHIPVTIQFREGHEHAPRTLTTLVPVEGAARPQFAYSYRLGAPVRTKVKTQQPLPIGKSLPFSVQVKNIGEGPSLETIVAIKTVNGKGPFIEVGRVKLGKLMPKQSTSATLRFHVDPSFAGSSFQLALSVIDSTLLEGIEDQLEFTVGTGRIDPAAGPWYRGPAIRLTAAVPLTTASTHATIQAAIQDDQRVKDYFVFVGDKKITYTANAAETDRMAIATELPLEEGSNVVTIAARDNNNLLSRHTVTIYRQPEEHTARR